MTAGTTIEQQLRDRAFEAIFSLARTLGSTLDVKEVAKRSLFTVSGQLLVRKTAFYLKGEAERELYLCESLGIRPSKLFHPRLVLPVDLAEALQNDKGLVKLTADSGLPKAITKHFQYATSITDSTQSLGMLLLGDGVGQGEFDESSEQLLQTMGVIIGTTLQRGLAFQEMITAKTELERAEQLRQHIIEHVSHEFNTPLTVMKSTLDLLRTTPSEDQAVLLEVIDEAAERLDRLVRSVLSLSRDDEIFGNAPLSQEELVERVVEPVLGASEEDGSPCLRTHELHAQVLLRVSTHRLETALEALLENAWRFQGTGEAWVAVHCYATSRQWWEQQDHLSRLAWYRRVTEGAQAQPDSILWESVPPEPADIEHDDLVVVIEVMDGGIGVPEPEQDVIFEAFTQASNSTLRGVSGAGVGLSTARRAVREMGGDIVLRSAPGEGSVFAILLPAHWVA